MRFYLREEKQLSDDKFELLQQLKKVNYDPDEIASSYSIEYASYFSENSSLYAAPKTCYL